MKLDLNTCTPEEFDMSPFGYQQNAWPLGFEEHKKWPTMAELWDNCPRGEWLAWIYQRVPDQSLSKLDVNAWFDRERKIKMDLREFCCDVITEQAIDGDIKVFDVIPHSILRLLVILGSGQRTAFCLDREKRIEELRLKAGKILDGRWSNPHKRPTIFEAASLAAYHAAYGCDYSLGYSALAIAAHIQDDQESDAAFDRAALWQADKFRSLFGNPFRK